MAIAQGSRSGLSYVKEVTYGSTPLTPSMIDIPFTSHTLGVTREAIEDPSIRSDRARLDYRQANDEIGGEIVCAFRALDYDAFLESAFMNAFAGNILKTGVTQKSLTIEDRQEDITKYQVYRGITVSEMSMTVEPKAIVNASFTLFGKSAATISGTPLDASITGSSLNRPYDSFTGTVNENGSPVTVVSRIEWKLNNNVERNFIVGSRESLQNSYGRCVVNGTISVLYQDDTLVNRFRNEEETSLQFTLSDGASGNDYTFLFPRIKFTGANMPVAGEGTRVIQMPFEALYDAVEQTTVKLTVS